MTTFFAFRVLIHVPKAAAYLTTSTGVRASPGAPPMVPRIPEMDFIRVKLLKVIWVHRQMLNVPGFFSNDATQAIPCLATKRTYHHTTSMDWLQKRLGLAINFWKILKAFIFSFWVAASIPFTHDFSAVAANNSLFRQVRTLRSTGSPKFPILDKEQTNRHEGEKQGENAQSKQEGHHGYASIWNDEWLTGTWLQS